jgi:hypothetical protein
MSTTRKIILSRRDASGSKAMSFSVDDHEGAQLADNLCVNITVQSDTGQEAIRMPRYKLADMLEQLYSK